MTFKISMFSPIHSIALPFIYRSFISLEVHFRYAISVDLNLFYVYYESVFGILSSKQSSVNSLLLTPVCGAIYSVYHILLCLCLHLCMCVCLYLSLYHVCVFVYLSVEISAGTVTYTHVHIL